MYAYIHMHIYDMQYIHIYTYTYTLCATLVVVQIRLAWVAYVTWFVGITTRVSCNLTLDSTCEIVRIQSVYANSYSYWQQICVQLYIFQYRVWLELSFYHLCSKTSCVAWFGKKHINELQNHPCFGLASPTKQCSQERLKYWIRTHMPLSIARLQVPWNGIY